MVYIWVDRIYIKAGLEKEKAALLVIIGALADGVENDSGTKAGYRESTEGWRCAKEPEATRHEMPPDRHLRWQPWLLGTLASVPDALEQPC
jgi:hypothetical protein